MKLNAKLIFKRSLNIIGLIILLIQSSCAFKKDNTRIIVAGAGKITSLDPSQANTFHAIQLISALGDPLYRLDKNGNLIPILAAGLPEIKKDGLTVLIPLREDVLFHDGSNFNAEAMVFSIKRFMKIGTMNYIIDNRISSVEEAGTYLLRIKLKRKSSSIKGLLTSINLTPVSPRAYLKHKDKFLNKNFIGTGPYQLEHFSSHQQRLKPFEGYWGKPAKNKGVNFISLTNSTTLFIALRSKEIDLLLSSSLDEDQRKFLDAMASKGELVEGSGSPLEIGFVSINTNSFPLTKNIVREAIALSIDRNLISNRVSYGSRKPLRSIVPPVLKEEKFSPWPKYNPNKAKDLFIQAGFCNGKKSIIPLTFRSNVPADKLFALTWQEQIKRDFPECLNIKLNGVESTTIYKQLNKGTYQLVMLEWRGAYPDPEAYLSPLLSCEKFVNSLCKKGESVTSGSFWASSLLNKSLKESDKLVGLDRRLKLKEVEDYASKGNPYIPIWLVSPKAWGQSYINKPEFDGSGYLLMDRLEKVEK